MGLICSWRLVLASVAVLALATPLTNALNNGLGLTPALGWNSDYCTNCTKPHFSSSDLGGFQYESFIIDIANFMAKSPIPGAAGNKTLQQLGFNYVNMDASWNLKTRSTDGQLQPDPALWPHGLNYTVGKVHDLGLKFGLYGDRGTKDCAGNPGAYGHEIDDANFMARNKIDLYKEDSCASASGEGGAFGQYGRMRDALNATGYPVWFALCGWETIYAVPPQGGNYIGNSARIGPDTGTGWSAVLININNGLSVSRYAGPAPGGAGGYWNDGSLMLTPGMGHTDADKMTNEKHRTQFNAWSLLAMNMLITGNLSALNPYVIETWTNPEVLAINQDTMGVAGFKLNVTSAPAELQSTYTSAHVAECGGEPQSQIWTYGSPLAGFFKNPASSQCLNVDSCGTEIIYDGCATTGATCGGGHDSYHPNEMFNITASGQIVSQLAGSKCLTVADSGTLSLAPCVAGNADQTWKFTNGSTLQTSKGLCVTASAPPPPPGSAPPNAIGRPLVDGKFAIMMINHEGSTMKMTCGTECLAALGLKAGTQYIVRDAWEHSDLNGPISVTDSISATVPPNGTSVVFVLRPNA